MTYIDSVTGLPRKVYNFKDPIDIDPRKVAAEVADRIRTHPELHNQLTWFNRIVLDPSLRHIVQADSYIEDLESFDLDISEWPCGTTACVAGHAAHVALKEGAVTIGDIAGAGIRTVACLALSLDYSLSQILFNGTLQVESCLSILDYIAEHGPDCDVDDYVASI